MLLELVRSPGQELADNTWALQLCSEMGRGRWPRGVDVRNVSPGMRAEACLIGAACMASPGACGWETSGPEEVVVLPAAALWKMRSGSEGDVRGEGGTRAWQREAVGQPDRLSVVSV